MPKQLCLELLKQKNSSSRFGLSELAECFICSAGVLVVQTLEENLSCCLFFFPPFANSTAVTGMAGSSHCFKVDPHLHLQKLKNARKLFILNFVTRGKTDFCSYLLRNLFLTLKKITERITKCVFWKRLAAFLCVKLMLWFIKWKIMRLVKSLCLPWECILLRLVVTS